MGDTRQKEERNWQASSMPFLLVVDGHEPSDRHPTQEGSHEKGASPVLLWRAPPMAVAEGKTEETVLDSDCKIRDVRHEVNLDRTLLACHGQSPRSGCMSQR